MAAALCAESVQGLPVGMLLSEWAWFHLQAGIVATPGGEEKKKKMKSRKNIGKAW